MNLTNNDIKNLKDKKYRRQNSLFMVEGDKFCRDLLNEDVEIVYTVTSNKELAGFPNICVVSNKQLESLATTKTCQETICVCKIKGNASLNSVNCFSFNVMFLSGIPAMNLLTPRSLFNRISSYE